MEEHKIREQIAQEIEAMEIEDNSFHNLNHMISIRSALEQRKELIEWVKANAANIARGNK